MGVAPLHVTVMIWGTKREWVSKHVLAEQIPLNMLGGALGLWPYEGTKLMTLMRRPATIDAAPAPAREPLKKTPLGRETWDGGK